MAKAPPPAGGPKQKGAPLKDITMYIQQGTVGANNLMDDYAKKPGATALIEMCHIEDAMANCHNYFATKKDGNYNKDAQESLDRIASSLFASVMSHFETYQRNLFAGVVEASRLLNTFDVEKQLVPLIGDGKGAPPARLVAFRGDLTTVGMIVADGLSGWQHPVSVNAHFGTLIKTALFEKQEATDLAVMWQLRHSIVHSAMWLSRPDSQKVGALGPFGNTRLAFEKPFINAAVRRLHKIVKKATSKVETAFRKDLRGHLSPEEKQLVKDLFLVETTKKAYLK